MLQVLGSNDYEHRLRHYQKVDLAIWTSGAIALSIFNNFVHEFPLASGGKVGIGFLAIGLFANLTLMLDIAYYRLKFNLPYCLTKHEIIERKGSLTNKLQIFAVLSMLFIAFILVLLIRHSFNVGEDNIDTIAKGLYLHLTFVLSCYLSLIFMVISKYGRNLRHLLSAEITAFSNIYNENYDIHVPAISNDEIGQIAQATNRLAEQLEVKKAERDDLEQLAFIDPLTRTHNRNYLDTVLIPRYESVEEPNDFSLLFIDLDHFKRINDTYGHACGDLVLVQAAHKLIQNLIFGEQIVRCGGEEFMVLMPKTNETQAMISAENLRKAIEETVIKFSDAQIKVTASIGISSTTQHKIKIMELADRADQALYEAKSNGRNQVVFKDFNQ